MGVRQKVERVVFGPEPVRWCSELVAEDPTIRFVIEDLQPETIGEVAEVSDTKVEFREALIDAWE